MSDQWKKTHEFHGARYERKPDPPKPSGNMEEVFKIIIILVVILFIAKTCGPC
jgi:hypothetical protein